MKSKLKSEVYSVRHFYVSLNFWSPVFLCDQINHLLTLYWMLVKSECLNEQKQMFLCVKCSHLYLGYLAEHLSYNTRTDNKQWTCSTWIYQFIKRAALIGSLHNLSHHHQAKAAVIGCPSELIQPFHTTKVAVIG